LLEHHGARAVPPRVLEPELEPVVGEPLEPVLCDRRAGDVTAEPLELSPIAAVDALPSVHVDAAVLGNRLVGAGRWRP